MNIRKNLPLAVSALVTVILVVIAAFFLVRFAMRYHAVTRNLRAQQEQLDRLNRRNPFPNEENIRQMEANRAALALAFRETQQDLARDQFEPAPLEPARFPQELRGMRERLGRTAMAHNVVRPSQTFGYGFDRYFKGELPRKDEVPRLLVQVNAVESVCRALFESGVTELLKVERQTFEETAATPGGPDASGLVTRGMAEDFGGGATGGGLGSRAMADPGGLFSWERVAVEFTTRESGFWNALNGLNRTGAFTVVGSVTVVNETARPVIRSLEGEGEGGPRTDGGPGPMPTGLPPGAAADGPGLNATGRPLRPPSREERIVTGRDETIRVRLEADVYRFQPPAAVPQ